MKCAVFLYCEGVAAGTQMIIANGRLVGKIMLRLLTGSRSSTTTGFGDSQHIEYNKRFLQPSNEGGPHTAHEAMTNDCSTKHTTALTK